MKESDPTNSAGFSRETRRDALYRPDKVPSYHIQPSFTVEHKGPGFRISIPDVYSKEPSVILIYNRVASEMDRADRLRKNMQERGKIFEFEPLEGFPDNFFTREFLGISLEDIAALPIIQNKDNIRMVTEFWYNLGGLSTFDQEAKNTQALLSHLIAKPLTHPEINFQIHPKLRKIRQGLMPALEYFKDFLYNNVGETEIGAKMLFMINNFAALGMIYCMEQDGLTLGAAERLFLLREMQVAPSRGKLFAPFRKIAKKRAIDQYTKIFTEVKRLEPWQVCDRQKDALVEKNLEKYNWYVNTPEDIKNLYEDNDIIRRKWKQYRPLLKAEKNNQLTIEPDTEDIFKRIVIKPGGKLFTSFVVLTNNGQEITLDIDKNGRVFGIPAKFALNHPHADQLLFHKVMSAVIPRLREIITQLPKKLQNDKTRELNRPTTSLPTSYEWTPPPREPQQMSKKRKAQNLEFEKETTSRLAEELQQEMAQITPHRVVSYSSDMLKSLARNINDQELKTLTNKLRRFEFGTLNSEMMVGTEWGVSGATLHEIRQGRWRIILQNHGSNVFSVIDVFRHNSNKYHAGLKSKIMNVEEINYIPLSNE